MVRGLLALALLAVLAGCGADGRPSAPTSTPAPSPGSAPGGGAGEPTAPVLVQLTQQRPGALIDKITVRTRRHRPVRSPVRRRRPRAARRARSIPRVLERLKRGLAALPPGLAAERRRRARPVNGATYIVRYRGRTLVARQGVEPEPLREPARLLAGLLVGDGMDEIVRRAPRRRRRQHARGGVGKAKEPWWFFQRQGAAGATLDTVSVRADGTPPARGATAGPARASPSCGCARARWRSCAQALRRLPQASTMTCGSPPPGGAQYLLRIDGHAITGRAGGIAPRARAAVKVLNGYIDGIGVSRSRPTSRPTRSSQRRSQLRRVSFLSVCARSRRPCRSRPCRASRRAPRPGRCPCRP